ncbi:division/cell wall cluster transcriptional repressor MraZ [Haliea sp. E17]|uniref:division/cell wall cluster transcriptional repressor MraZ n=1 Tax=Haliea sp. E17 TaxID=3401576 RepID=UPI003AAF84D4
MFRGVQQVNMDAKGRLAIPARQRERLLSQCEGHIVVTIDTQAKCLVVYPLPEWERIEKDIQNLPALNQGIKRFQRLVLGYATDIELDGSGRMLLPPAQRAYAALEKEVMLVGQGNKLEIWSQTLWQAEQEQALADSGADAALPDELLSLKL